MLRVVLFDLQKQLWNDSFSFNWSQISLPMSLRIVYSLLLECWGIHNLYCLAENRKWSKYTPLKLIFEHLNWFARIWYYTSMNSVHLEEFEWHDVSAKCQNFLDWNMKSCIYFRGGTWQCARLMWVVIRDAAFCRAHSRYPSTPSLTGGCGVMARSHRKNICRICFLVELVESCNSTSVGKEIDGSSVISW